MTKFAKEMARKPSGPVATDGQTYTHEGGAAYSLDSKSELFTLAITTFVEPTYYEKEATRRSRFIQAIHRCTQEDPDWTARLIGWTRQTMNMRSTSVLMACEYIKAGGSGARQVIDSVCVRADEPAEIIGYWLATYGRTISSSIKRGVGDAARRLYSERNALRWDSANSSVRMADVIELCHVKPKDNHQSTLFRWIIDTRHKRETISLDGLSDILSLKEWIAAGSPLDSLPRVMSWERLSTYRPMDADGWNAVIPQMGAMALTRNLRNFDEAGISDESYNLVVGKLTNEDEIRKSRQFPFRFWTAYREAPSKRWAYPLELAVRHACSNIPNLGGRTLVLCDISGSMQTPISQRSTVQNFEVGGVFGGAVAKACGEVDLVCFGTESDRVANLSPASDILTAVEVVMKTFTSGCLGHGTNIWHAIERWYDNHDRVVIFTDMQAHDDASSWRRPQHTTVYAFDLGGYGRTGLDLSTSGSYQLGGFSDSCFGMMAALEGRQRADWPF